jgi:regulator of sirC expression with transglutaminase-like and TPR domain
MNDMMNQEVKALITLLDDPSLEVYSPVEDKLLSSGIDAIPELEKAWETTLDEQLQGRIETIIQKIQFNFTKNNFNNWLETGAVNLLEGAFLVSQFQYPEITYKEIDDHIERITKDVWLEINNNLTALEKVKILNYILFELHKYNRNTLNYYSPQNSFINQVIESKKGNPISLAIIYSVVANRLGMPVYGVNLPKNFILAYVDEYRDYQKNIKQDDILFYINPYNKGAVLGKKEIDYFLKHQKIEPDTNYYIPCSHEDIILRVINNLILAYNKLGHTDKVARLQELSKLFK